MRGSKILITGGTGFIGCNLLWGKPFPNATYAIMAKTKNWAPPYNEFIQADALSYRFKKGQFTHIIHSAEAGLEATRNVLSSGARVLLISSGAAYYPGTPYADSKLESEALVRDADGLICRLFSFVGPHLPLNGKYAIGNFIRDALQTGDIKINGDGSPIRSYMHTLDMARWVWTILDRGKAGKTYDVGAKAGVSMLNLACEIAKQAKQKTGLNTNVTVENGTPTALAPSIYLPIHDPKPHELGLKISIPLKDAISRTLDWYIESLS